MANSKLRCVSCKQYRPRADIDTVGRKNVCSDSPECRSAVLRPVKAPVAPYDPLTGPRKDRGRLPGGVRKTVRNRDKTCRVCGSNDMTQAHHIFYRSQGGPDSAGNLILLCEEHHRMVHSRKRYWQPVLLAYIWMHYAEGRRNLTVPAVERELVKRGLKP